MCICQCVSQRFVVSVMSFIGLLISVGYRSDFSLVMTHVAKVPNQTEEDFFIKCSVYNSSKDWKVDWSHSLIQDFHSVYFAFALITQIPGGILATRFSPKKLCGFMVVSTSVLFIILPFLAKVHYGFVFAIRGLQGFLEGGSVPVFAGFISTWAPKHQRTVMMNIACAGAYLSPAVGFIVSGLCSCLVRWDSIFFIAGGLGVVWFVVWMLCVCDSPDNCPHMSEEERSVFREFGPKVNRGGRAVAQAIPWRKLLTSLPVAAVFTGSFCFNWIFSMLITQQPQYFQDSFQMNTADIGLYTAIPSFLMTVVVIAGGFTFDKLMSKGILSRTVGRKVAQTLGFGTEAVCLFCLYFVHTWEAALTLLCVGVAFGGLAISGFMANPLDLSPQYASVITGIARIGTIGAILSTQVAAKVLQHDHSINQWKKLWLTAGVIQFVGVIIYDILASGHTQPWDPSMNGELLVKAEENRAATGENDPLIVNAEHEDRETWERSLEDSLVLGG